MNARPSIWHQDRYTAACDCGATAEGLLTHDDAVRWLVAHVAEVHAGGPLAERTANTVPVDVFVALMRRMMGEQSAPGHVRRRKGRPS